MASLIEKTLETLKADIELIEDAHESVDRKLIKKELNLIKQRVVSIEKLVGDNNNAKDILGDLTQRISKLS